MNFQILFFSSIGFLISSLLIFLNQNIDQKLFAYPGFILFCLLFLISLTKMHSILKQKIYYFLGEGAISFFLSMYVYFFIVYILSSII